MTMRMLALGAGLVAVALGIDKEQDIIMKVTGAHKLEDNKPSSTHPVLVTWAGLADFLEPYYPKAIAHTVHGVKGFGSPFKLVSWEKMTTDLKDSKSSVSVGPILPPNK